MKDDIEILKTFEALVEPDQRNMYFLVDDGKGNARKLALKDIHEAVNNIQLDDYVPAPIRSHFAQAKNLAVYSWFHYPFNVTAQFMGFVSVEFALKQKFSAERTSLAKLIQRAVDEGLITDDGFSIAALRESNEQSYVESLVDVIPSLRNRLAHGSNMLHSNCISSLQICAEFINQVFSEHTPSEAMESEA